MNKQAEQLIAHANKLAKANFMQFDYDEDNPITDLLQAVLVIAFDNDLPDEIDRDMQPVYDELKNIVPKDIQETLTCIWTDANMAIDDDWDRSDEGFQSQIDAIEDLSDKYSFELTDS